MQHTLLGVAALVALALADDSDKYRFTFNYHTWCGPHAGSEWGKQIMTKHECKRAAKHFGFTKDVAVACKAPEGDEEAKPCMWHAGCIFQPDGQPYFVEDVPGALHDNPPSRGPWHGGVQPLGGYLCKRLDVADTYTLNHPENGCAAGLEIEDEEKCSTVASGEWGLTYVHSVPTEHWKDGCIVNNGKAYWTPPAADGSQDVYTQGVHNHGTICHQQLEDCTGTRGGNAVVDECNECNGMNKNMDACGVCGGDGMSCADPCKDKMNAGRGNYCEMFDAIIRKGTAARVAHKMKNFCKGVYGTHCPKNCCRYENPEL